MNILEQFKKALNMDTLVPAAVDAANIPQPDASVTTTTAVQDHSTDQQVTQEQSASGDASATPGATQVTEVPATASQVVDQPITSAATIMVDSAASPAIISQNTQVAAVTATTAPKSLADLGKDLVTLEADIQTFIGSKAEFISSYVDRRFKQIRVAIEEEAVKEFETIKKTKQKAITDLEADWSATVSWVSTKFNALKGKL